MKNQPNKATVKDGLPTAERIESNSDWKLIGHSHQIADTGDYDGHYEITNGKISLLTQDDDDESLQPIVDALNDSGCKFYQDDWFEFENKMLKDENAELREIVKELEGALTAALNVARAYDRSRFVDILDKAEKSLKK